jgi:hypothetical protein
VGGGIGDCVSVWGVAIQVYYSPYLHSDDSGCDATLA